MRLFLSALLATIACAPQRQAPSVPSRTVVPGRTVAEELSSLAALVASDSALTESEVDRPVHALRGAPQVRYPTDLRNRCVEGRVIAFFVVDTTGVSEPASIHILYSSHRLFSEAVREHLPLVRFDPAQKDGRPVRAWSRMPYNFEVICDVDPWEPRRP